MGWKGKIERLTPPIIKDLYRRVRGIDPFIPIVMTDPSIHSFSQYNEDLIIDAILGNPSKGFYVDVGANHPQTLSNTKRFYDRGWTGINIEPNPTLFKLLDQERKNDVNLNIGLGTTNGELDFYLLDPDTLSSFNPEAVKKMLRSPEIRLVSKTQIEVKTLRDVLEKHADGQKIDFMSIDVEGYEKEVLGGGDWQKFRPRLILMEINQKGDRLIDILRTEGYRLVFANGTNGIFMDQRQ